MTHYDAFNGDADGICSLHQLRLAEPRESVLVTGVKRDINLVARIDATAGDSATVLDVSFDRNRDAVQALLDREVAVFYADHHFAGELPASPLLDSHIDTAADICTGLIVNAILDGAHLPWAVTAAFGDNLDASAERAAAPLALDAGQIAALRRLGILLNYNGYGSSIDDLHFDPAELYRRVSPYANPFDFIADDDAYAALDAGYDDDTRKVAAIDPETETDAVAVYLLPNAAFARRVSGVHANALAQAAPDRAHAILSDLGDDHFLVSVRAPLNHREGADELCRRFDTGGGRKAAAGINRLPESDLGRFVTAMQAQFG
ncbi:MAG: acetyltransferase [Gammaproteobacteria bacterium]|nr:MAG: acetyltransferase [Gammaproteobacteria bacterium]